MEAAPPETGPLSQGSLLGGRIAYAQPLDGYRTGIEPVLLAASVPARPGDHIVEGGTGAGAGLLCLAARLGRIRGLGLERDARMAAVSRANVAANGFDMLEIQPIDLAEWRPDRKFDHAMANPPWHDRAGTASPLPGRRLAKVAGDGLLADWANALAGSLRHRGTLTFILPASSMAEGILALSGAGCREIAVLPMWKTARAPARFVILTGTRGGKGPTRLLPGLVLHQPEGGYTGQAEAVLREGAALVSASPAR